MKALNPLVGEIERDERSTSLTKLYLLTSQDFVGQPYCPPLIEIRRVRGTLTEAPPGIRQLCRRPRGDSQASVYRPGKTLGHFGRVKNGLPKEEDLIVSLAIQSSGKWLQETILRQSGVSELAP